MIAQEEIQKIIKGAYSSRTTTKYFFNCVPLSRRSLHTRILLTYIITMTCRYASCRWPLTLCDSDNCLMITLPLGWVVDVEKKQVVVYCVCCYLLKYILVLFLRVLFYEKNKSAFFSSATLLVFWLTCCWLKMKQHKLSKNDNNLNKQLLIFYVPIDYIRQ